MPNVKITNKRQIHGITEDLFRSFVLGDQWKSLGEWFQCPAAAAYIRQISFKIIFDVEYN